MEKDTLKAVVLIYDPWLYSCLQLTMCFKMDNMQKSSGNIENYEWICNILFTLCVGLVQCVVVGVMFSDSIIVDDSITTLNMMHRLLHWM